MDKSMTCPFCNAGVMDLFPVKNCGMKVPDDAKHGDIIAYPTEERKGWNTRYFDESEIVYTASGILVNHKKTGLVKEISILCDHK